MFTIAKGEETDTAYIFESAIDAISFIQLHPKIEHGKFISMAGLKDFAVKRLSDEKLRIISCVDNDKAGNDFNKRQLDNPNIKAFTVNEECKNNNAKDFNELLTKRKAEQKMEQSSNDSQPQPDLSKKSYYEGR
ncbi:MAG: toprim domain-containing protein [Oscillospiraceae bacterium]|nr:toprim domain-containing protein [Oscillospiraceae bacterium]